MTNEEAINILKHERICRIAINAINKYCVLGGKCKTCEYAEDMDDVTNAIGLAIEALNKQCAGSEHIYEDSEWWKNYIRSRMSQDDASDNNAGKTEFKSGDKFILELGQERKMFDEFEIVGTDLYVKTSLLEKLTRYEQEEKLDSAQSEPPRAYWIRGKYSWDDYHYNDTSYKCSRCGKVDANIPRYCPGCGAKMEEEIR